MTSRKGNPITWTSFNYPSQIVDGTRTYNYDYDASRQKWKQIYNDGSNSETTYFAGRIFEKNVNSSDTEHRHHVMANGTAVALFVERTTGTDYTRYFTHDHLGSIDGIILSNGTAAYVAESFSAYGERRDPIDWVGNPTGSDQTKIGITTDRGYTDHINLEKSSLVHMNGRVYDAEIGRFLSPDPHVGNPYSTQGFNRYAYVQNNPLRYTDPSGFFCVGPEAVLCINVFASIASFLFGSDDEEPPPDFCKDNTVGCGGTSAGRLLEVVSLDTIALPLDDDDGLTSDEAKIVFSIIFENTVLSGGKTVSESLPEGDLSEINIKDAEAILEDVIQRDDALDRFGEALEEAGTFGVGRFLKVGKLAWEKLGVIENIDPALYRQAFLEDYLRSLSPAVRNSVAARNKPLLDDLLFPD